jgi:hypothetical protein
MHEHKHISEITRHTTNFIRRLHILTTICNHRCKVEDECNGRKTEHHEGGPDDGSLRPSGLGSCHFGLGGEVFGEGKGHGGYHDGVEEEGEETREEAEETDAGFVGLWVLVEE